MEHLVEEAAIAYNQKYTPEEYLNMKWEKGQRYEYWDGEIVAMAGGSINHATIIGNLYFSIRKDLKGSSCKFFNTDVILKMQGQDIYFLPDLLITCDEHDILSEKFIENPSFIIEVLSKSTEIYDRTQKWDEYRKIKSLKHYLLVSQHEYKVEMFSRANEHTLFYYQSFKGLDEVIAFKDMGFEIHLKEIYEGISF